MIKTTSMLLEEYNNYSDSYGKIRRLRQEGKLFLLKKGIYETNGTLPGYFFSSIIYGPSYLSLDYALSKYGMIPETVHEYTAVTCLKGKKKYYHNHFGDYSYQDIPSAAYPFEINIVEESAYYYKIATPEKALCDKLYKLSPVNNISEIKELLFDNLRIDYDAFVKLNFDTLTKLAELYNSNNLRNFNKMIRREFRGKYN